MQLRKIFAVFLLLSMLITFVSGASYSFNGSEPKFLEDIGPQEDREDNPWAALVVALGVAGIIYLGLKNSDNIKRESHEN